MDENTFDPGKIPLPPGMVADDKDSELVAQLDLCLSIMLGLHDYSLTEDEEKLLRLEKPYPAIPAIPEAIKDIMMEIILMALPQPEQQIDLQLVAVNLLREIERQGGMMLRKDIKLPNELIDQLEQEGILTHGDGGVRWGRFAARAVADVEAEYGKGEKGDLEA